MRWMTVIGDNILKKVTHKRSGYQMVIGHDYEIKHFIEDVTTGVIKIKCKRVALLVGNNMLIPDQKVNMGNRIEKLINNIRIKHPQTEFLVSGVFPRPDKEKQMELVVKAANETIGVMCRRLAKFQQVKIKYVPLQREFLEKWRHYDNKSGKMQYSTRIISSWDKWFEPTGRELTEMGLERVFRELERAILSDHPVKPLQVKWRADLPQVKVQISNEGEQDDEVQFPGFEMPPQADGLAINNSKCEGKPQKPTDQRASGLGTVAKMIDKWESLSQLSGRDAIDRELGEDSIVEVNIGDQSDHRMESEEDGDDS